MAEDVSEGYNRHAFNISVHVVVVVGSLPIMFVVTSALVVVVVVVIIVFVVVFFIFVFVYSGGLARGRRSHCFLSILVLSGFISFLITPISLSRRTFTGFGI